MSAPLYLTVATRSYLPRAHALAASLQANEPGRRLRCYLVEEALHADDNPDGTLDLLPLSALALPNERQLCFQYNTKELATAVRPFALRHALREEGGQPVVYLDCDTQLLAPLSPALEEILAGHEVAFTPHLLSPTANITAQEREILRAGIYNSGVIALRPGKDSAAFLDWWCNRLEHWCIEDPMGGILHDQRWLDLAVGLFGGIGIIRHPGINVGPWNMHERQLSPASPGQPGWQVRLPGDQAPAPLLLLHFSGLTADRLSTHLPPEQEAQASLAPYRQLAAAYREQLARAPRPSANSASFCHFANGQPITPAMREVVRLGRVRPADPFADPDLIRAALPASPDELFWPRITYIFNWACSMRPVVTELQRRGILTIQRH